MGASMKLDPTKTDAEYVKLALAQYDLTTVGNACKMSLIAKGYDKIDYTDCKYMADFAKKNNLAFRGHVLLWPANDKADSGHKIPKWIQSETDLVKLETFMEKWIPDTINAIGTSKAVAWDVINEIVPDGTSPSELLKDTVWIKIPYFFCKAFKAAKKAAPF